MAEGCGGVAPKEPTSIGDAGGRDAADGGCGGQSCAPGELSVYGGCVTALFEPVGGGVGSIAVDSDLVYWTTGDGPAVMAVSHAGGVAVTLSEGVSGAASLPLALDSDNIYFAEEAVYRLPKLGGVPSTLAVGLTPPTYAIAVYGGQVYLTDSGSAILSVPINGGTLSTVATGLIDQATHYPTLAADSSGLYVVPGDMPAGFPVNPILQLPLDGGAPVVLGTVPEQQFLEGIALDENNVYTTTDYEGMVPWGSWLPGALVAVPKAGGAVVTLAALGTTYFSAGLVVDETSVYWLQWPTNEGNATGVLPFAVIKAPLTGGQWVTIGGSQSGCDLPQCMAIDDTSVYWSDGSTIWKVAK
jgi:hypothetical protein